MKQLSPKQMAGAALGGLALVGVVIAVTSGGGGAAASKGAGGGSPAVDAILEAWKAAGHTVSAFAPMTGAGPGGGDCREGTVDGIEAVLCTYDTTAAAEAARAGGLERVGSATGAALTNGQTLLIVADRKNADASGRALNRITKTFRKP
jgi:hypothetical protein